MNTIRKQSKKKITNIRMNIHNIDLNIKKHILYICIYPINPIELAERLRLGR